jgi:hypothetical protein
VENLAELIITRQAEEYLQQRIDNNKNRDDKLNLVLHIKEIYKNCYTKIEPDISFEEDQNYLDGINKISNWKNFIDIYIDPALEPLIKDKKDLIIDLKGKLFKRLIIKDAESKINYGCRVVFGKDIITSNSNLK